MPTSSPHTSSNDPIVAAPSRVVVASVVDGVLLGKALGFGLSMVLVAGGVAWLGGLLPPDLVSFVAAGACAAVGAAMVAVWLHGRFLAGNTARRLSGDGQLLAGHLQGLLAAAFAVKLVFLVVAVFVLRQQDVKFQALAAFAIAFATASLLCQVATAAYLARAIQPKLAAAAGPTTRSTSSPTGLGSPTTSGPGSSGSSR